MRKLVIAGLLAATLTPAIAAAQDRQLRDDRRDVRQEQRDVRRDRRDGAPGYVVRNDRRDVRDERRDVRQDSRQDWRGWRDRHPDDYRGPAYVGPRGYAYRPVGVGYRFRPEYYDRRYWVDPYRYHLAPVGPYERWVRYGRDVVRIDVRNGRVVDLHGGFFF